MKALGAIAFLNSSGCRQNKGGLRRSRCTLMTTPGYTLGVFCWMRIRCCRDRIVQRDSNIVVNSGNKAHSSSNASTSPTCSNWYCMMRSPSDCIFLEETEVHGYLDAIARNSAEWCFQASAEQVMVTSHIKLSLLSLCIGYSLFFRQNITSSSKFPEHW
jgi:hypothetical protein